MAPDAGYELLDVGAGRRLERFGALVIDRPFPAAVEPFRDPTAWAQADLRFERDRWGGDGRWSSVRDEVPESWPVDVDGLHLELRPTPAGQVGLFPEQRGPWRWIRERLARIADGSRQPPTVLNLFAYTGGATLVAAMAGAAVTHVDASRPSVAWARRNAQLSGLAEAPIRWIVDDALAFVRREGRRKRRYDGVILDPPSYGHGAQGERWTLADHLPELLEAANVLLREPSFMVVTAHATGLGPEHLCDALREAGGRDDVAGERLMLRATSGAEAEAGIVARWPAA